MPREPRRCDDKPGGSSPPPPLPMPRERRRGDDRPERSSLPCMPLERHRPDQGHSWFHFRLPNGQQIPVYKDRQGVLFTDHCGPTRPVADVCNELFPGLIPDRPPPVADPESKRPEEDQKTPTPNPQYVDDLLNKAYADHKLQLAQRPKELLDSTTLVESSITNAASSSLPQSPSCEVPDILELELNTTPSLSSCVFSLTPTGLLIKYFVRVDKEGRFHTYPDRGGPFQSLHEAQQAIDSHHVVGRNNLCMDGLSSREKSVRYALYWPHDGTRRNSAEAFAAMKTRCPKQEVVKALLDKYNEDNDLLGDLAYRLEEIVRYKPCFDGKDCDYRSYSHLNMTIKIKGADDPRKKLYFAEVTCMRGEHEEYVLTCICAVEPDANGECLVCGDEMKHPIDAQYNHGRSTPIFRCCSHAGAKALGEELITVHDEAWLEKEEARVRQVFEEVAEDIKKEKAAKLTEAIKEEKAAKLAKAIKENALKEVNEATEVGTIGHSHGKSAKYVVPARRK
ncbi:hypothetical protein ACQJBY_067775 [Aegilops geniculata]